MQSMDEAGNISWSSLISVTSSFPAHGETTWDLFYFMGEGLKRNPPKQAQLPSVYTCPAFPIFSVNLTEIQLLPMAPALIKAPLLWHPHTGASWSSWQLTEHTQWVTVLMGEALPQISLQAERFWLKMKTKKKWLQTIYFSLRGTGSLMQAAVLALGSELLQGF